MGCSAAASLNDTQVLTLACQMRMSICTPEAAHVQNALLWAQEYHSQQSSDQLISKAQLGL